MAKHTPGSVTTELLNVTWWPGDMRHRAGRGAGEAGSGSLGTGLPAALEADGDPSACSTCWPHRKQEVTRPNRHHGSEGTASVPIPRTGHVRAWLLQVPEEPQRPARLRSVGCRRHSLHPIV